MGLTGRTGRALIVPLITRLQRPTGRGRHPVETDATGAEGTERALGVSGRLVGPAAFKAVEGSLARLLVGSIPIHSRAGWRGKGVLRTAPPPCFHRTISALLDTPQMVMLDSTDTTPSMTIQAVIFDLDGVLIDSGPAHHQSWQMLARELGCQVTAEQFAESFGRQNRDIIPLLFGGPADDDRIHRLSGRKEELYRELVRGRMPAIPGGADLVRQCRDAGLKLAIGSSAPVENVRLALGELGISACFHVVVHDGQVVHGKPNPDVFLVAADRLRLPAGACLVIEDAPSGIRAAKAAGMKVVGLTTYHPREALKEADLVIDRLAGLTPAAILSL